MSEKPPSKSANLQGLINRRDKVLAVLHPPTAAHARIMEKAGCEALFVGTGGVVGAYTGLSDVGTATMTECITIAGWIADSISIPVIMDGDTGHGGIMAVRRMVRECICAGIAGIRIDDQPIEGKRKTQSAGVEVVPLDQAIARYRAAVDMKNELDPNFVVMAQCYARDASDGTLEDTIGRLRAYREEAGVDWVQLFQTRICLNCPVGVVGDRTKGGRIRRRSGGAERECLTPSFEERTDDATRSTLATHLYVSRFMPAMRPSRFTSRQISRRSRRSVGASPFSTFPATCLAKLPPPRRDALQTPYCILGATSDVDTVG
jgi:hypothetical protein